MNYWGKNKRFEGKCRHCENKDHKVVESNNATTSSPKEKSEDDLDTEAFFVVEQEK